MKKFLPFLLFCCAFGLVLTLAMPSEAGAFNRKKMKKYPYAGSTEITYDQCAPDYVGAEGVMSINFKKIGKKGKVKSAKVFVGGGSIGYSATGKILRKDGKTKIRLTFPSDTQDFEAKIKARFKSRLTKIWGTTTYTYQGCEWIEKIRLNRSTPVG